jgi:GNAT superfamily N-acetyltransferase
MFEEVGLAELFATISTPPEDFRRALDQRCLWVAITTTGRPVGFAMAGTNGGNAHLDELDVDPAHGHRGLGRALVKTFIDWARQHGYAAATLTTQRDVPWNAPFYASLGFEIVSPANLSPALRDLVASEIARGLPREGRVAMHLNLR